MSTITKEQLRERAREKVKSLEFAVTQTAFANTRAELEEELELARIALGSLEAEAVCVIDQSNLDYLKSGSDADVWPASRTEMGDVLLYRSAPPAPVSVPDDVSGPLAHAYKELTPTFMRNHIDVFERYGIYPDGSVGIQAMRIALDGMKRRAAMLQGAEPVTTTTGYKLPDGWVACIERLPESKPGSYEYLVFESLNNGVHHDYWNVPDVGDDCQFTPFWSHYDRYVTHWMPLPAAPQQEVKP